MHDDSTHPRVLDENPDPTAAGIFFVGAVSLVWLIAIVFAAQALYYGTATREEARKLIADQPQELRRVETEQLELLNGYRWVDQTKGVVAIPIERAMELAVEEARR